jgi:hypothetical protein
LTNGRNAVPDRPARGGGLRNGGRFKSLVSLAIIVIVLKENYLKAFEQEERVIVREALYQELIMRNYWETRSFLVLSRDK